MTGAISRAVAVLALCLVVGFSGAAAQTTAPAQPGAAPAPTQPAPVAPVPQRTTAAPVSDGVAFTGSNIYEPSVQALTMLLVLAVLLENAFATIFNWRVFLAYFDRRGVKTLVMIVIAFLIVWAFEIDILASLVAAYKAGGEPAPEAIDSGAASMLVTALILAGGSESVFSIMRALGLRNDRAETELERRPLRGEAWIAVHVRRERAVGPIMVRLSKIGDPDATSPKPIVGVIRRDRPALRSLLMRSLDRFPQNGGYSVEPDKVYELAVEGQDASGNPLSGITGGRYVFADGAIFDLEVTM